MNKLKRHIFLIGMPGCGKSSLGKKVSSILNLPYVDTDLLLTQLMNMDTKEILETQGEEAFRNAETNILLKLCKEEPMLISTGGGLPLKPINRKIMHDNGYIIFIDRPLKSIKANIRIEKRPLLVKKGIDELDNIYKVRYPIYTSYADTSFLNDFGYMEGLSMLEKLILEQMKKDE